MHAGQDMYLLWRLTTVPQFIWIHVTEPTGKREGSGLCNSSMRKGSQHKAEPFAGRGVMTMLVVRCLTTEAVMMSTNQGTESSTTLPGGRRRHF